MSDRVQRWVAGAPTWQIVVASGGYFAVAQIGLLGLWTGEWAQAVFSGSIAAVLFGLIIGPVLARHARALAGVFDDLDRSERREARRAAWRGPVPADPRVRAAARRVAEVQRDQSHRFRRVLVPAAAVMVTLMAYLAVTETPAFAVVAALAVVIGALPAVQRRLADRRVERLAPDRPSAGATG